MFVQNVIKILNAEFFMCAGGNGSLSKRNVLKFS